MKEKRLKIAIQREGRLTEKSLELLKKIGLDFENYKRKLISSCLNFPLDILFVRDDDIIEYIEDSVADLGIVGLNTVYESQFNIKIIQQLGFGYCALKIAIPKDKNIKNLNNIRIATSYPNSLNKFLKENRIEAKIIKLKGSVEIAPTLKMADAICDLVSTGNTLEANNLKPIYTIFNSEACLIGNGTKGKIIKDLITRIKSVVEAEKFKYIMLNAPKYSLKNIKKIMPGLKSPTVIPLADKNMVAVHAVMKEKEFWDIVEKLKRAQASGILLIPIEKLII